MEAILNLREILSETDNWREDFTLFHQGKLNINHAGERLLTDLAGLTARQIESLEKFKTGRDGLEGTEDDVEFSEIDDVVAVASADGRQAAALEEFFGVSGSVRRIESKGFCYGVNRTITLVTAGDGTQVLAWEER
jgi:hypothetical protein